MSAGSKLKKLLPFLIPLLLLAVVVVLYLRMQAHRVQTHAKSARDAARPIPVDVVKVASGEVALNLPTECVARPNPLVRVVNPMAGRAVTGTRVAVGAKVSRGDPLLSLDTSVEATTLANAREQIKVLESYVRTTSERADYFRRVRAEGLGLERDAQTAYVEWQRALVDLANAKSTVRSAEADLARLSVKAPVSGIVMGIAQAGEVEYSRLVGEENGERPTGGGSLAAIAVIDPIVLECELPEEKLVFVRPGQTISAAFPSLPGERFDGKLTRVEPGARTDSRTVGLSIELPNPQSRLLPGVHGLIEVQERWTGLRIPSVSLVNPRVDVAQVFVVDREGKARLRSIKVGGEGGGWVQVLSGLQADEQVVVVGQIGLVEGDTVRVGRVTQAASAPAR